VRCWQRPMDNQGYVSLGLHLKHRGPGHTVRHRDVTRTHQRHTGTAAQHNHLRLQLRSVTPSNICILSHWRYNFDYTNCMFVLSRSECDSRNSHRVNVIILTPKGKGIPQGSVFGTLLIFGHFILIIHFFYGLFNLHHVQFYISCKFYISFHTILGHYPFFCWSPSSHH